MRSSSRASDRIYILKPEACRLRRAWWLLVHAVAAAGLAASALPGPARLALIGAVIAHGRRRSPGSPPLLLVTDAGRWSVPARGLFDVALAPGSAHTSLWARLVLGRGARAATLVLLRGEYGAADWRRIQLALRAAAP